MTKLKVTATSNAGITETDNLYTGYRRSSETTLPLGIFFMRAGEIRPDVMVSGEASYVHLEPLMLRETLFSP